MQNRTLEGWHYGESANLQVESTLSCTGLNMFWPNRLLQLFMALRTETGLSWNTTGSAGKRNQKVIMFEPDILLGIHMALAMLSYPILNPILLLAWPRHEMPRDITHSSGVPWL